MPSTTQLIRLHRLRRQKLLKTPYKRAGFSLVLILSVVFFSSVMGLIAFYFTVTTDLPSIATLPTLLNPKDGLLMQPTHFYDRSGQHIIHTLQNPAIEERQYLSVPSKMNPLENGSSFSPHLITATLAISDPTFWGNAGYSTRGILENEHNTIAQRLVSDLLLLDEPPGFKRAVRERILAAQITSQYGREQVLEWYLNSANYGSFAYGADSAAQIYFGKSASQLNLVEAAILAGVSESPGLNPFTSPQASIDRGKIVIDAMEGQDLITPLQVAEASQTTIKFQEPLSSENTLAPNFIDLAWRQLSQSFPIQRIERGGYKIITSLDFELQTQVLCTLAIHRSRLLRNGTEEADRQGNAAVRETCQASKLLPTLTLENESKPDQISANIIVYDPFSSQILALVTDTEEPGFNSISEGRPPGSLFTPFVYLTAFTRGFNPASLLWDVPLESTQLPIDQLNPQGQYQGPLRLRNAFATDKLIPAAQLINQIGIANILKIAQQSGLTSLSLETVSDLSNQCPGCSLLLGGGRITLLDAAQAFGIFTNQGYLVGLPSPEDNLEASQKLSPVTVLSVLDNANQTLLLDPEVEVQPVISTQLAYLMTHIMSDESARWPSLNHPNPLEIGRPTGAKIGTTFDGRDLWTLGFTPELVVGVWLGTTDNSDTVDLPWTASATLWHAVIKYATQDDLPEPWPMPPGITRMDVCDPSGMLPTLQCPTVVSEVFLSGQEPTQADNLYQVYQINRETGRLATVFTPPELVEEKIYLNIPPEASAWAEIIGMEAPPTTYDLINSPTMPLDVAITSPEMFSYHKGLLVIEGVAQGPGFVSYRLQAGEGINPTGWIVVQEETNTPVSSDTLGTWDTSGRNGLYALQLIVLREDQKVDTATIQITLDNEAPQVAITYPVDQQVYEKNENSVLTFLIEAGDNLGLDRIEYYLDGELVSTQYQPPFAYPWNSQLGPVLLTVKAVDNAGNTTQAEAAFSIE